VDSIEHYTKLHYWVDGESHHDPNSENPEIKIRMDGNGAFAN
jgi:hypothetical protein